MTALLVTGEDPESEDGQRLMKVMKALEQVCWPCMQGNPQLDMCYYSIRAKLSKAPTQHLPTLIVVLLCEREDACRHVHNCLPG